MAYVIPTLVVPQTSFDAEDDITLSFAYDKGGQIFDKIQIEIMNNDTLNGFKSRCFKLENNTYKLILGGSDKYIYRTKKFTIPKNTLDNGHFYLIRIKVGDGNNWSGYCKYSVIKCYKKSSINFINIKDNDVLVASYYTFGAEYTKTVDKHNPKFITSDSIYSYQYKLYRKEEEDCTDYILVNTSNLYYCSQTDSIMTHTFSSLSGYYKLEIICTTNSNVVYSNSLCFETNMKDDKIFSDITPSVLLHNNEYIHFKTTVEQYIGESNDLVQYIDGTKADLRNGNVVCFSTGVSSRLSDNYILQIWADNFNEDKDIVSLDNRYGNLSVRVYNNSVHLFVTLGDYTSCYIQKINNLSEDDNGNKILKKDDTVHIVILKYKGRYDVVARVVKEGK